MSKFRPLGRASLVAISALVISLAILALPAEATPGFTIAGLRITPPVGAFGATPVGGCNLVTYDGCTIKTFTVTNVGSTPILFNGFGIAGGDPLNAALVSGDPSSGCEFTTSGTGSFQLLPGESCLISVAFGPTTKGLNRNELHIWYLNQFEPIAVVPLLGVGI
jgi:hypothetical protein